MARSHFLRARRSSVENGPYALDTLELCLRDATDVARREQGLAFRDMCLEVKGGDDEDHIDERLRELEVGRHSDDAGPKIDAPLAADIVGGNDGEEEDADDASKEYVVHVRVPRKQLGKYTV